MGRSRQTVALLVKLAITGVLLALIVNKVGVATLADRFANADVVRIVIAAAISFLFLLLKSYKWHFLLQRVAGSSRYGDAFRTYLIGLALAIVTPGRVGEVGRAYYLREGDRAFAAGVFGVDRVLDFFGVFSLACAGAFVVVGGPLGWLCLGAAVASLASLYWPQVPARLLSGVLRFLPGAQKLSTLPEGFAAVPRAALTTAVALTLACYGLALAAYFVLLSAFEPVAFGPVALVYPLVMLTNVIQITIGGVGVREGAAVLLLAPFGVSEGAAVNATFMVSLLTVIVPGLFGALLSARHRP